MLSLSLALAIGDLREVDDLRLDVDLDISDFSALATALGIEVGKVGRAAFAGTLGVAKENVDADGSLTLGKTTLTGKLKGAVRDGRPHISGNISSKVVHLRDVKNVRALIAVNRKRQRSEDTENTEAADGGRPGFDQLSVGLDVAIASIAGGSKAVGGNYSWLSPIQKFLLVRLLVHPHFSHCKSATVAHKQPRFAGNSI